jgi:hypothetical protein
MYSSHDRIASWHVKQFNVMIVAEIYYCIEQDSVPSFKPPIDLCFASAPKRSMTVQLLAHVGLHSGNNCDFRIQSKQPRRRDQPWSCTLLAVPVNLLIGKKLLWVLADFGSVHAYLFEDTLDDP